jgi:RNA 3'-phosphate cyclase
LLTGTPRTIVDPTQWAVGPAVNAKNNMIKIDGTHGEGGGQILRTALALSILSSQATRLCNIRGRRPKPGLMPQHLWAVEAAAKISHARVQGATLGSLELSFEPGIVSAGDYGFDIGTAGAVMLVLQTVAIPLSFAHGNSRLAVTGGTHVPLSPSYEFFALHWAHILHRSGFRIEVILERPGFYPKGGGRVRAAITPLRRAAPLRLLERGKLRRIYGVSLAAALDLSVAQRQMHQARTRLTPLCADIDIEVKRLSSYSPGTALLLVAEFEHTQCAYGALGARGKPAERVADEAVDALLAFLAGDAAIDEHLADQLILPLAVADGVSELSIARITPHLVTNTDIVRLFLPVEITISGEIGMPGRVRIAGTSTASQTRT